MYIKKVTIENIRSISHFEMDFPESAGWHVIIGDNGAGKSSVVRAIAATLIGPEQIGGILPIWSEWLREGTKKGTISLELKPDWKVDVRGKGQPSEKNIHNVFELTKNETGYVSLSTNAHTKAMPPTNYNWGNNAGWFSVGYGPFRRFTGGEEKRNKVFYAYPKAGAHLSVFGEEVALTEALDWLKELDRKRLKQKESQEAFSVKEPETAYKNESEMLYDSIKAFINQSGLLPHSATFDSVGIEGEIMFKDGNGNAIKVTQMSDGYRSILSLMLELIRQLVNTYKAEKVFENRPKNETDSFFISVPGVVLIDEIDAHLHPTWQTRIGQWFTKYFPNIQFIVTTHSPLVCRACEKGSIWRLAAPGSGQESGEITGIEKDRLVFGNILDAYGTEVFGENTSMNVAAAEQRNRLGELYEKSMMGLIETNEEIEFSHLKSLFPTFQLNLPSQ